eukprot:15468286-Alexandrium_andersonii.AAC.1
MSAGEDREPLAEEEENCVARASAWAIRELVSAVDVHLEELRQEELPQEPLHPLRHLRRELDATVVFSEVH